MTADPPPPGLPPPETPRPWVAEIEVTPALAVTLINAQCPSIAPVILEPYGSGWDNTAYLVNGQWVFRFPRRAIAVPLLEMEARVLPHLAPRLPLPIPTPVFVGRPDDRFPWPFVGYRRITGRAVSELALDDRARAALARPLAEFLRAMHAVDVDDARTWGAAPDTLGRLDVERLYRLVPPRLDALAQRGTIPDVRPWLDVFEAGIAAIVASSVSVDMRVLHGDFYARHVLVAEDGRASGVIDFGDLHIGHPGLDLGIAFGMLPPSARAAFFEAYGAVSDAALAVARFRALSSAIFQEAYGRDVGDRATEDEGRRELFQLIQP